MVRSTNSSQRSVSVEPGQMALTVMPFGPNRLASALVALLVPILIGPDMVE